jgi:hypothetical protein
VRRRALLLCLAGFAALGCRRGPDSPVQTLVDVYAPGFRLGSTIGRAVRHKYQLAVAPYVGYVDSAYFGPDGLRTLYVKLDQYVDDGAAVVSPGARVEWVSMRVQTPTDAKRIEQHLRSVLGAPEETCFRGLSFGRRVRSLYWSGRNGVGARLLIPRGDWRYSRHTVAGTEVVPDRAALALGVDRPPPPSLQTEPCSAKPGSRVQSAH